MDFICEALQKRHPFYSKAKHLFKADELEMCIRDSTYYGGQAEDFVPAGHTSVCECSFPGGSGVLQPIACYGAIQSGDKGCLLYTSRCV